MPADPRRDYELKVAKAARNIIFKDTYFQAIYRNKQLFRDKNITSWQIYERTLILFTIPAYPALAIHLDEIKYEGLVYIKPKILIECAWQDADLAVAKAESIKSLKDVRYSLREHSNLSDIIDGEYIQIGSLFFSGIETSFFGEEGGTWTHISTMEVEIETA